jgi:dolichyl-phosphate-mannose-protein mannosyltransferase
MGNDFAESPLEVAYGSKLTLKNYGYGGGLLHSHVQSFPVGSLQQQVTCYHYKDENNHFVVTPTWDEDPVDPDGPIRFLSNGDTLRLIHASTGRNLHSHPVTAPVTKENYEVSCYGNMTVGDGNDLWVVEVVDDTHRSKKDAADGRIHSLTTRMRFKHASLGCYLRAANAVLPQWGFKQVEVSCTKENNPRDVHTYWNVESHWNERCEFVITGRTSSAQQLTAAVPAGSAKLYRSPFFRDFFHLNVAMWTSNNALVPDPDKEDILASQPMDWPFLRLGLRMCGWGDHQIKFYLLGTPVIWWWSSICLGLAGLVVGWYAMRMQRDYRDWAPGEWDHFLFVGKVAFGGWALHYCELGGKRCVAMADGISAFLGDGQSHVFASLCECIISHATIRCYRHLMSSLSILPPIFRCRTPFNPHPTLTHPSSQPSGLQCCSPATCSTSSSLAPAGRNGPSLSGLSFGQAVSCSRFGGSRIWHWGFMGRSMSTRGGCGGEAGM